MVRRLLFAAALALAATPAWAQPAPVGSPKPKPPAPAATPAEAKPPEAAPDATAEPGTDPAIQRIADGFFKTLQAGQPAKAYQDIWKGTPMDRKQADMDLMISQTAAALQLYGKVHGWESMSETAVAPSFRTHSYMVRADMGPLFFRLQFYRKQADWMVYRVDFADQIARLPP